MNLKHLFIIFISTFGFAQGGMFGKAPIINKENFDKQRIHFGYFLGFNTYDFKIESKLPNQDVEVATSTGFNVGLVANLRLSEMFDIRFEPGFYAAQRNLTFTAITDKVDQFREVNASNLHFPLLLKYSALRAGNIKPYLLGGFSTTYNLSSNQDLFDDNGSGKFRVKDWTYNYEIGFGIDFYLEYFKFSPSIRGVFGLNNELVYDKDPNSAWTSNISGLNNRAIFINFTFH
jgi:Outer membrane protein beta-barrel domain